MEKGQKSKKKKVHVLRVLPLPIYCIQCHNAIHRGTKIFGDDWTFMCKNCPNKITLTKDGVKLQGSCRVGEYEQLKTLAIDQHSKKEGKTKPSIFDGSTVQKHEGNLDVAEAEEWHGPLWRKKRALEIDSVIRENMAAAKKKNKPRLEKASSSANKKSSSSR